MKFLFFLPLLILSVSPFAAQKSADPATVPVEKEPHHHTVLRNDSVLVMVATVQPGDQTLFHVHSYDRASIGLSTTTFTQQKPDEAEGPSTPLKPGSISASTLNGAPFVHRVHNLGPGVFEVLDVEFLQRPQQPSTSLAGPVTAENPSARIYTWTLVPGTSSPMHTHNRPYLIVAINKMPLKMTAPDGQSSSEGIQAGDFHWIDGKVTHSLTNEGTSEGQIVEIELK